MSIEGAVSVDEITGEEDQLIVDKEKLEQVMKKGDLFEGDQIELEFKLVNTVESINTLMDSLLKISFFDGGKIDADDGEDEKKIVALISDKLNTVIADFLSNEEINIDDLMSSLDNVGKQVELAKDEQGYYDEFVSVLKSTSFSSIGKDTKNTIQRRNDALQIASL